MKTEVHSLDVVREAFQTKKPFSVPVGAGVLPALSASRSRETQKRRHTRRKHASTSMHPVLSQTLRELAAIEAGDTRSSIFDRTQSALTAPQSAATGGGGDDWGSVSARPASTPSAASAFAATGGFAAFTPPSIPRAAATPSGTQKTPSTIKRFFSTPTVTREALVKQVGLFESSIVNRLMAYESVLK
jgi:hypothetical protein